MAIRDLRARIRITADTREAERGFSRVENGVRGLASRLGTAFAGVVGSIGAANIAITTFRETLTEIRQERALDQLLKDSEVSANAFAQAVQRATDSTVSLGNAVQLATRGIAQGLSPDRVLALADAGTDLARIYGIDVSEAIERLTSGIVRQETEALELLGITVKIGDATKAYAEEIGKTADELTIAERQTALYNQVLSQTSGIAEAAAEAQGDLIDSTNKAIAALQDLGSEIVRLGDRAGSFNAVADSIDNVADNTSVLTRLIQGQIPELEDLGDAFQEVATSGEFWTRVIQRYIAGAGSLGFVLAETTREFIPLIGRAQELTFEYDKQNESLSDLVELEAQDAEAKRQAAAEAEKLAEAQKEQNEAVEGATEGLDEQSLTLLELERLRRLEILTEREQLALQEALERQARRTTAALREQAQVTVLTTREFDQLVATQGEAAAVQAALASGATLTGNRRLNLRGGGRLVSPRFVSQRNTSLNGSTALAGGFVTLPTRGRTGQESRFFAGRTTVV